MQGNFGARGNAGLNAIAQWAFMRKFYSTRIGNRQSIQQHTGPKSVGVRESLQLK